MLMQTERELIVEYGKKMSADGLSSGTSGNISIYNDDLSYMAISPSGIGYFDTKPEDIVVMDLKGNVIEGDKKPSSEWDLHTEFYKAKPHIRSVVHTHSIYCSTFAALGRGINAVHYVIADAGVSAIPCAKYQTFGTSELAKEAVLVAGNSDAVLLSNHGALTCGTSIKSAYGLSKNIEYLAQIQYQAECIGKPNIVSDEEIDNVVNRFKSYGQSNSSGEKTGY